jgi:hypothetical protein
MEPIKPYFLTQPGIIVSIMWTVSAIVVLIILAVNLEGAIEPLVVYATPVPQALLACSIVAFVVSAFCFVCAAFPCLPQFRRAFLLGSVIGTGALFPLVLTFAHGYANFTDLDIMTYTLEQRLSARCSNPEYQDICHEMNSVIASKCSPIKSYTDYFCDFERYITWAGWYIFIFMGYYGYMTVALWSGLYKDETFRAIKESYDAKWGNPSVGN